MIMKKSGLGEKVKRADRKQGFFQLIFAVLFNGYAAGFAKGKIFTGKTKAVCVPVLNCHSCPGALGACPIGSLQKVLTGSSRVSFYALGMLMLFGLVLGRLVCGFLCPFGWIQDLLHRIPGKKAELPERIDRPARKVKYAVLLLLVLLLPMVVRDEFGIGSTFFCAWVCPAGTLEAGLPLLAANPELRLMIGGQFYWKLAILILLLLWSVFTYRPFCRYLCPLGAFYGLFNRFSLYQYQFESEKCTGCGACSRVCQMKIEVTKNVNSAECIRCGRCIAACPESAISRKKILPAGANRKIGDER